MMPKNKSPRIVSAIEGFSKKSERKNNTTKLILDKAWGHWTDILESLGINHSFLTNKHGPCPACAGKDRFRFDDKNRGTFICNKCGAGDGIKLLQLVYGWSFSYAIDMIAMQVGFRSSEYCFSRPSNILNHIENAKNIKQSIPIDTIAQRERYLKSTWSSARILSDGDPVDTYLKSRGIQLTTYPNDLRFHPNLPYYNDKGIFFGRLPAMLALIQNVQNQKVCLHRTYLGDGCKADVPVPKKLMTPIKPGALRGAAIKLFEPIDKTLALAEGIETALSYYIATNIPVWSTINSHGLEKVIIPHNVINIIILVDNDKSGCGQKAGIILSKRLVNDGKKVKRIMPPTPGFDFNDLLLETSQ